MSRQPGPTAATRSGAQTRQRAQQIALRLFTERGYEATTLRDIADALGINKASLYYYFDGKEAILQSLLEQRGNEAEELVAWLRQQPPTPDLIQGTVMRWVGSFSEDKLQGVRFLAANPLLIANLTASSGHRIGEGLTQLAEDLTGLLPDPSPADTVMLRMALLSINAAVLAAASTDATDDAIIHAAKQAALALLRSLSPTTTAAPD